MSSEKQECGGHMAIVERNRLVAHAIAQAAREFFSPNHIHACRRAADALELLDTRPLGLAIIGLDLPDVDGLDLISLFRHRMPALGIFVVSDRCDEHTRSFLQEMSVDGWCDPSRDDPEALRHAMREVLDGRLYFTVPAECPNNKFKRLLTPTEHLVFATMGAGLSEQDAADRLGVSKHTLHSHLRRLKLKLGVTTHAEVVREAVKRGVVRMSATRICFPGLELPLAERTREHSCRGFPAASTGCRAAQPARWQDGAGVLPGGAGENALHLFRLGRTP